MRDFSFIKYASIAIIFTCLLDFAINILYTPALTSSSFINIILAMAQVVTILLQFFSWFYLMNMMSEVRHGGYSSVFAKFWPIFATGAAYIVFFFLNIAVLFAFTEKGNDIYSLWNNGAVMAFWSLQRLVCLFHYALSMYFTLRILCDPSQFL